MIARKLLAAGAALAALGARAEAQCPDGSPPPCGARQAAAPTTDANRILILPFRVATTDTLLAEGLAELLATEFTGAGEGIPRAVDMGTALSAWYQAGGGLRSPLPRARAISLARRLGAGLVSEASVVGIGNRITVTATVLTVPDGRVRGSPTRVTAPADSIEPLLRAAANDMLANLGGHPRAVGEVRFTNSSEAMRAYLQGMAEWRRGRIPVAATWFDRAIALDSLFAQAWFRRANAASWKAPGPGPFTYAAREWALRDRLSADERMVLTAVLGRDYPRIRTLEEWRRDAEEVAQLLPDSPEAQYGAGDWWFHRGSVEQVRQAERIRFYLERAAAIDSQAVVLQHLLEIGIRVRDTALLRRVIPPYARTDAEGRWAALYLAAHTIGDSATLRAIGPALPFEGRQLWVLSSTFGVHMRASAMDTLAARWIRVSAPDAQARIRDYFADVLFARGRPAAAAKFVSGSPGIVADRERLAMAMTDTTGIDVAAIRERLGGVATTDPLYASAQCALALWRVHEDPRAEIELELLRHRDLMCVLQLETMRTGQDSATIVRAVAKLDSAIRQNVAIQRRYQAYELARAWDRLGQPARALAALRLRTLAGPALAVWTLPYEARLAQQVGDTAGAVRALQFYVDVMMDAEPPFAEKRDRARADLAALLRR